MKKIILFSLLIIGLTSSFIISKKIPLHTTQETSILRKIANAHGFENWKNVREIKFTFNVDRDTVHYDRNWAWNPRTNDITATLEGKTIKYNWSTMDSTARKTNAGFINDKYWLLTPFQLIWDEDNITHHHTFKAEAPISHKPMQKLTIVYGNEGGYTPGDAYDFYFEDDYIIQEWIFRKRNTPTPSLTTTFEDYKEFKGLKIATSHKRQGPNFNLYFTNIDVR